MAALASSRVLKRAAANLPGIGFVKAQMRRRYAAGPGQGAAGADQRAGQSAGFTLDAAQAETVERFVRGFYAGDFARWPFPPAAGSAGA